MRTRMLNMTTVFMGLSLVLIACSESASLTAQQQQGKRIYESLCNKCHNLIEPTKHTDREWTLSVEKYGTNLKLQRPEKDAVIAYLTFVNDIKK